MNKVKGIVMKTSRKITILYTEGGDYLEIKTPKSTPVLGQVIEVDLPAHKPLNQRFLQLGSIAAILFLALGLGVFNILSGANTAVAAVVVDINSSKELFVNRDAKVLKVIDLTQGTQTSPSDLQLQGKDIYTAVDVMIDQANTQGILNQSKNLVMTSIIPMDNRQVVVDQSKLRDSIGRHMLEKNISADLIVSKTDETTQKTARSLGMSVNHYQVYKRLLDKGLVVNSNGSSSNDTLHMLAEANTTLNSLFPQESMTITPQNGIHQDVPNSMGAPMTGESMPSTNSHQSGSSQRSPNMTNTLPSSSTTMPDNHQKSSAPSVPMPMQDNSGSSSSSGKHDMMR
ncbi:anti-sigma factor domain-containing protein [Desulfosporosinus metallidurans]|uniref:RsgI N-terminal anti-sigma domain-containing protein n=1 Tax=Desulfosporosinus metallidurans TaxID=1888891 RepID=A0A1Q8QN59_9FIRM|nr:anti-sigma factor domain-containing protein [Desulfosporosinus metallidurans]OLN28781.1 hypothetical protein DSOL_3858 [Desulfosporosinus metallidurans]